MELLIKSLEGSYLVSGLESEATIADVKCLLHQQHMQQVPEPEEQCLVGVAQCACAFCCCCLWWLSHRQSPTHACLLPLTYTQVFKHSVLSGSDAGLQQLGITHGDQLVMLPARPAIKRPRAQTTPVRLPSPSQPMHALQPARPMRTLETPGIAQLPAACPQQAADTAAIRTAITDEARSRGIEHTLKEERPPVARRGLRLPAGLLGEDNEQLLQLLQQAFDGQLLGGLQLNVSEGGQPGEEGEGQPAEEEQEVRFLKDSQCMFHWACTCRKGRREKALV